MTKSRLRVATYNVHGFVGSDGRSDPHRVVQVIRELEADVVALQEVATGADPIRDIAQFGELLGMAAIPGPTLRRGHYSFGNALLSAFPVLERQEVDLSTVGAEPRAALVVILGWQDRLFRVVATHFGLRARERRRQAAALAEHLVRSGEAESDVTVFLGDFNDWTRSGRQLAPLRPIVNTLTRVATFPARRPLLPLDRIGTSGPATLGDAIAHATPAARAASDHLPLVANLSLA